MLVEPINVHWNKSDTHTYCVVACSRERIGVDIEYMKKRPFEKISRRYFHTDEVTNNKEVFYELWCKKEAYTKWKRGKIAENMKVTIDRPLTRLNFKHHLDHDNVVGYLCT